MKVDSIPDPKFQFIPVPTRVADPVHFRPDPDPANQYFKTGSRILLTLNKNQFKHLNFFHIKHISSDIWFMIIFIWKNEKIHLKMCKTSFLKYFFLVYTTLHCQVPIESGSGENFLDPTGFRSGSATLFEGLSSRSVTIVLFEFRMRILVFQRNLREKSYVALLPVNRCCSGYSCFLM